MGRGRRRFVALLAAMALLGLALPAQADALTRKQATAKAMKILKVRQQKGRVVLFAFRTRQRARVTVGEAVAHRRGRVRRLRRSSWVFWLDLAYGVRFAHHGRLLALDARSGRVLLRRRTNWFPIVNRRLVPWLRTKRGYEGRRYKVFQRPRRRRATASGRARAAAFPRITPRPQQFARDCMVTVGLFEDQKFAGDRRAMNTWADAVGLKRRNARPSRSGLNEAVDASAAEGCRDVFVYVSGHGEPPPRSAFPRGRRARYHLGPETVGAGELDGGPAAVMVHASFFEFEGAVIDRSSYITPQNLIDLFARRSDLTFKLKIDACFSGRFEDVFERSDNLLIAEFSSEFNEASLSNIPSNEITPKLQPNTHQPIPRGRDFVTVEDRTDNPTGAGEFTNGNAHGLFEWAQSAPGDQSLVDAIEESFTRGARQNFALQAGWTNPFVRRRGARTTISTDPVASFDPIDPAEFFVRGQIRPPGGLLIAQSSSPVTAIRADVSQPVTNFICPPGFSGSIAGNSLTCSGGSLPVGSSYELKLRTSPASAPNSGGRLFLQQDGSFVGPFTIRGPS